MPKTLFGLEYWEEQLSITNTELAELINGDLATLKTAKTVKDVTTLQELNQIVKAKLTYRDLCEKEIIKAKKVLEGAVEKSKLYIDRECGY
ncbi:MAG: hypothetical protein ACRCZ0_11515 [Cetobacterium sp.]